MLGQRRDVAVVQPTGRRWTRSRPVQAVAAWCLGVALLLGTAISAAAAPPYILDTGHIDLFEVTFDDASQRLILQVKDDTDIYAEPGSDPVFRDPSEVIIAVDPAATEFQVPDHEQFPEWAFLGPSGSPIYLLDWNGFAPGMPWPGWSTERLPSGVLSNDELVLDIEVSGPGQVFTYHLDAGSQPVERYIDTTDDKPEAIPAVTGAHVHTNWVFTALGTYTLDVTARAKTVDGNDVASDTKRYTFHIGPDDAPSSPTTPEPSETPTSATPTSTPSNTISASPTPTTSPSPTSRPTTTTPTSAAPTTTAPVTDPPATRRTTSLPKAAQPVSNAKSAPRCIATTVQVPATPGSDSSADRPDSTAVRVTDGHFDFGARIIDGSFTALVKDDRSSPAKWREPGGLVFELGSAAEKSLPSGLEFIGPVGTKVHMIGQVQEPNVPWLGWNTQSGEIVTGVNGPVTMTLEGVKGPGELAVFLSGSFGGVGQRVFDTVGGPKEYAVPLNTHQHGNWVFTKPGTYKVDISFSAKLKSGGTGKSTKTLTFAVGDGAAGVDAPNAGTSAPTTSTSATPTTSGAASSSSASLVNQVVGRTADGKDCELADTGAPAWLGPIATTGVVLLVGGGSALVWSRRRSGRRLG